MKGHTEMGKQELADIYNVLLPPTQKQILDIARTVRDTQDILVEEYGIKIKRKKRAMRGVEYGSTK